MAPYSAQPWCCPDPTPVGTSLTGMGNGDSREGVREARAGLKLPFPSLPLPWSPPAALSHSSTVPPSTHPSLQSPRGVPLVCCLSHFSLYNPRLIYGKTARSPCSISMCRDPQPLLTSWLVFQDLAGVEQGVGGAGCALHNSMG